MATVNPRTILLVEDEDAMRRFARSILVRHGFHVIEAPEGATALAVASAYASPLDLLLTDVIMPKVNGLVLAERLSQERPGIPVVYMSGYVEGCLLAARHCGRILLQKPFSADTLIATVSRALGCE